jgi:hypothetical protein
VEAAERAAALALAAGEQQEVEQRLWEVRCCTLLHTHPPTSMQPASQPPTPHAPCPSRPTHHTRTCSKQAEQRAESQEKQLRELRAQLQAAQQAAAAAAAARAVAPSAEQPAEEQLTPRPSCSDWGPAAAAAGGCQVWFCATVPRVGQAMRGSRLSAAALRPMPAGQRCANCHLHAAPACV